MTVYGSGYISAASCAVSLMHQALFAFLQTVVNDCPFLPRELLCPSMPRVARDCGSSALMFLQAWAGNAMRGWRRPHRRRPIRNEYFRKLLYRAQTCDGVIHHTRAEADGDTEHFGGNTSE